MGRPDIGTPIVPSWVVGLLAATCALIVLGFVSLAFFVSLGGLMIAGAVAFMAGSGAAAVVDPAHTARNAAVVAFYVVVLASAYMLMLPALAGPTPPGARGGPAVYPPPP